MSYFDFIDDSIMAGVNSGVRLWNSTTGCTKKSLTNFLSLSSLLSQGSITYDNHDYSGLLQTSLISLILSGSNEYISHSETKNKGKDTQDFLEHGMKKTCKILGFALLPLNLWAASVTGVFEYYNIIPNHETFKRYIGLTSTTLAIYALRAEDLPPRKNCISRGIDKLKDFVENYVPKTRPDNSYT